MAATDAGRVIKNAPYRHHFVIRNGSEDVIVNLTGLSGLLSKDSASASAVTNTPTEIGASGMAYLDLTVTEMTFSNSAQLLIDASNSGATDHHAVLAGEPGLDSGVCQTGNTSTTIVLRSGASTVNDTYSGSVVEIVRGTGAGQFRPLVDYVGSSRTGTLGFAWATTPDTTSVYLIHPHTGLTQTLSDIGVPHVDVRKLIGETSALTVMTELYKGATAGSVNDAGASTTDFNGSSVFETTDDWYNNSFVVFTTGDLAGLMRPVNDYTGATRNFSFASAYAWPSAPGNGDEFVVLSFLA